MEYLLFTKCNLCNLTICQQLTPGRKGKHIVLQCYPTEQVEIILNQAKLIEETTTESYSQSYLRCIQL